MPQLLQGRRALACLTLAAALGMMATGTGAGTAASAGPSGASSGGSGLDSHDVSRLRAQVDGEVLLAGDAGYAASTLQWSKTFTRRPCVVLRCNSTEDVQHGMAFARAHKLPLSARSGGHSYMGWSVLDDTLLLSLERLNHIRE